MTQAEKHAVRDVAHGTELAAIIRGLVDALDPDRHEDAAREASGLAEPPPEAIASAARRAISEAIKPLRANPALRHTILAVQNPKNR